VRWNGGGISCVHVCGNEHSNSAAAEEILTTAQTFGIRRLNALWRGHLLLFDKPQPPFYPGLQGYRLLAVFLLLEFVVRPFFRFEAARIGIAPRPWWLLLEMSVLTALACGLVAALPGVRLSQLGLYSWARWSQTEKLFFPQIVLITVAVFSFVNAAELNALRSRHDLGQVAVYIFVPQMIWGFYQEFLYRGILQTALVRHWGTPVGILASNLIFTFGPLHAYHFSIAKAHPSHLWIFLGIFSIGLYFAVLFARSGNLWIVALLHGLGDWFIDGLAAVSRLAG
jgi:uncharacterized protein